jgi:hypothetical protein
MPQLVLYVVLAIAAMGLIGVGVAKVKAWGAGEVRAEWNAANEEARKREAAASAKAAADLEAERQKKKIVIQKRTVYVDRNIEKLVDSGTCFKPSGVLCVNGAINGDKSAAGCNADSAVSTVKPAG